MRIAIVVALVALFVAVGVGGATASAQPAPGPVVVQGAPPPGTLTIAPMPAGPSGPSDRDRSEGSGSGMALLFWGCALLAVGGSVFVITRRNLIAAVMGMVATFFGVAALYMMLYAQFLAVIQMLVYAGAIMVLFVFVVMILNKPEDEPWGLTGLPGKALAAIAMVYLTFRLGQTLWDVKPEQQNNVAALAAPAPTQVQGGVDQRTGAPLPGETYAWGSTGAVGSNLFDEYLFPFEAVSILLLVGVVGAIAVARPLKEDVAEGSLDSPAEDV